METSLAPAYVRRGVAHSVAVCVVDIVFVVLYGCEACVISVRGARGSECVRWCVGLCGRGGCFLVWYFVDSIWQGMIEKKMFSRVFFHN